MIFIAPKNTVVLVHFNELHFINIIIASFFYKKRINIGLIFYITDIEICFGLYYYIIITYI